MKFLILKVKIIIITVLIFISNSFSQNLSAQLMYFAGQRNRSHFKFLENPRLKPFFAPDFVWQLANFNSQPEFERMKSLLYLNNPNIIVGHYFSACTTISKEQMPFPPTKMPVEECKAEWILKNDSGNKVTWPGQPGRYYLDVRKESARQAIITLAIAQAKFYGLNAISFDNCYWGYGVPAATAKVISEQEWTKAFMDFYKEAGEYTKKNGLKCYVNIASRADDIPLVFEKVSPFVDGIMTEMPFHPNIIKSDLVEREIHGYESVLQNGTFVFLLQPNKQQAKTTLKYAIPLGRKYKNIFVSVRDMELYPLSFLLRSDPNSEIQNFD